MKSGIYVFLSKVGELRGVVIAAACVAGVAAPTPQLRSMSIAMLFAQLAQECLALFAESKLFSLP